MIHGLFAQLTEVTGFGANPGNLKMYTYVPAGISANRPLVVVLHGCGQSASLFADESGWNMLADEYQFSVLYPEQKTANNLSDCFNWFLSGDIERNQGEAASIKQMIDVVISSYNVDTNRIFITGFSAGACMTSVMMACYPDVFKKGAIMAGTPYKSADGLLNPLLAMNPGVNKTPTAWGDAVRDAYSGYSGSYPKVAVFQGNLDVVVNPMNKTELVQQWTNVNNTDAVADITNTNFIGNSSVDQVVYIDGVGDTAVLTYTISGMGHAISIDPGSGNMQGGTLGTYAVDKNFFSTYWAADFFGLIESPMTRTEPFLNDSPKFIYMNYNMINLPGQNAQEYEIYNISGRSVKKGYVRFEQISLDAIPEGIYLLKLPNMVWRFIKMD